MSSNVEEKMSDVDRLNLQLAHQQKQLAAANLANSELTYKNMIYSLYLKYNLKSTDSFTEAGVIMRSPSTVQEPSIELVTEQK